jgi:hypothetical protein
LGRITTRVRRARERKRAARASGCALRVRRPRGVERTERGAREVGPAREDHTPSGIDHDAEEAAAEADVDGDEEKVIGYFAFEQR